MNIEKGNVPTNIYETVNAFLIVTVVFGFITYVARTIMVYQEKIARIKDKEYE